MREILWEWAIPGVSVVYLLAYLCSPQLQDGVGGGKRCLEQIEEWSQRCVSNSRSLGGKLTHKNIFGFGQTHVQEEVWTELDAGSYSIKD